MQLRPVAPNVSFPDLESARLDVWDATRVFERSVEERPARRTCTFYDGPPFATGSPHYGHILQGVVKDVVPRYWTMRGHRVERAVAALGAHAPTDRTRDAPGIVSRIGIEAESHALRAFDPDHEIEDDRADSLGLADLGRKSAPNPAPGEQQALLTLPGDARLICAVLLHDPGSGRGAT